MASEETLTCPKCQGSMRNYERNDVRIDQCSECRGIFLDRGELESLIDAESKFYDRGEDQRDSGRDERRYENDRRYDDRHGDHRYGGHSSHKKGYKQKSKKQSFLEAFLD